MKDKILNTILEWQAHIPYLSESQLAQDILDLIAKELPKEKRFGISTEHLKYHDGYNQCLKDIKHKLGVE